MTTTGRDADDPRDLPEGLPSGSPADTVRATRAAEPPAHEKLPLPRWLGPLAALCVVGLVPWIVYLALNLPRHTRSVHYDIAWVGYDLTMCAVLAALAFAAIRRRTATAPLAAVAATMLLVDAWFDVVTTSDPRLLSWSVASAVVLELPLAAICIWAAVNGERVRGRAYRRLWQRAEHAAAVAESHDRPVPR
ncbi:MAG: hypothetical protein ABJB98_06690 [Actinomycetota bacterium]